MKKIIFFTFTICSLLFGICHAQWQPDVRLTNDPANSFTSTNNAWCIAASGDVVHAVWYDTRDGNDEIYYKRSTDGGITWGADTRLTNNSARSENPSVSVSGSVVHVVWRDDRDGNEEIYYKRSTDGGISWEADTRLTNNSARSTYSSVSVSGSAVHVVWYDNRDGNYEIYYKGSPDGGVSWGADTRLTSNSANSEFPSVSVSGSDVHVVWYDERDGNPEIYYKLSTDGGISWGADTRLTNNSAGSYNPSVSVSGSVVHVVWQDFRDGNYEIYYKRSIDGGISWGADTQLTNNSADSHGPSISVSGPTVHIVWYDQRDGNFEIYYKRSTDGGISWGTDTRLTNNSATSASPSVSVSGSVVHVVWYDTRDGNLEIYYKRDPTGNFSQEPCLNPPLVNTGSDTTIYFGYGVQNAVLTASVTGGTSPYSYLWSNGATSVSITVSPSATTGYYVLVTDAQGCTATDTVVVNVIDVRCGNNNNKVLVCHNGHTICISSNAVHAHLNHGDNLGECGDNDPVVEYSPELPDKFELGNNYPNPFNPTTKIRFALPKSSFAKLVIYDALGREMETIVNEQLDAGTYEADWSADKFSSGIYYYKLVAGDYSQTKKMVLMK